PFQDSYRFRKFHSLINLEYCSSPLKDGQTFRVPSSTLYATDPPGQLNVSAPPRVQSARPNLRQVEMRRRSNGVLVRPQQPCLRGFELVRIDQTLPEETPELLNLVRERAVRPLLRDEGLYDRDEMLLDRLDLLLVLSFAFERRRRFEQGVERVLDRRLRLAYGRLEVLRGPVEPETHLRDELLRIGQ